MCWRAVSSVVKLTQAYVSTGLGLLCVRVKEVNERCHKAGSGERLPISLFYPLWCGGLRKGLQPHHLSKRQRRHQVQMTDLIDYRLERQENNIDKRGFRDMK